MIAPILHGKVSSNTSSPRQTNHSYITTYNKAKEAEIQRAQALQHALDEKVMDYWYSIFHIGTFVQMFWKSNRIIINGPLSAHVIHSFWLILNTLILVLCDKEMEPEMLEIVKGSKTRAQAMVDAAIKVSIHPLF